MTYSYKCHQCNKEQYIDKPMSESNRVEHCQCGSELKRVYESPSVITADGFKK